MVRTLLACCLIAGPALAQPAPHDGMAMPMPAGGGAATEGYKQAMDRMMKGMDLPYTGDADRDFVTGMLPHHQGAIDMALVELRYGQDPALKALARQIVASQGKEERFMRAWLARHKAQP